MGSRRQRLKKQQRIQERLIEEYRYGGNSDKSELIVEVREFRSTAQNLKTQFQLKLMLENKIQQSKPLFDKKLSKEVFEFNVNHPESVLYVQLVNFGIIGRGMYPIKQLSDQEEKRDQIKIFNDSDEQIGVVKIKVQWIHDVMQLITKQLSQRQNEIEEISQKIQQVERKLVILESIAPKVKFFQFQDED